jgi:hypothetical protein
MRVRALLLCLVIFLPRVAAADVADILPFPGQTAVDTLPTAIQDQLSLFRPIADSAAVAELVEAATQTNDPGTELAIAAAALWRRAGYYDLALASLDRVPTGSGLEPRALLERARTLLTRAASTGDATDRDSGEDAFWQACASGDPDIPAELWIDLRGLATQAEQEKYAAMDGPDGACYWFRRLVEERAWRSALGTGDRLAQHYGRLAHARHRYGLRKPRFVQSRADFRGRPPGLEMDDRGLIHLRMGQPERIEYGPLGDDQPGIAEHWAYPRPDGYWLYYFVPDRGDYLLVELLGPQAKPGHDFFQRYVTNLAVDPLPLKRLVFLDPEDPADAAERLSLRRAEQLIAREFQRRAITETPDAPEMLLGVDLLVETLRFLNPHRERASVWLIASARASDLRPRETADGWTYIVNARGSLLTDDSIASFRMDRRVEVVNALPGDAGLEIRHVLDLGAGRYPLTLAVLDGNREVAEGNWYRDTLVVPAYSAKLPVVSDLAIAADSGGTWTRDGETFLQVTPGHSPGPDGILHLYFEVYGVDPGGEYEVSVRILGEQVEELTPDDQAAEPVFRLNYRSAMPGGPSPIGSHHSRIDLRDTAPGRYRLHVHVQELATSTTSLPSTTWVHVASSGGT